MPKKKKAKKSKPVRKKASRAKKTSAAKPSRKSSGARAKASPAKSSKAPKAPVQKKGAPLPLAPKTPPGIPGEKFLGKVEDYFGKISVIALTVKESLALEDTIHVIGHTTDFAEVVKSMQVDRKPIKAAKRGDSVGIKVGEKARKGDNVYRVG